ncbi:hypothetical protein L288_14360 [Sphingobium quisquiliarum P25]|uniref:DUF4440 domain-containing protein n=1 Tax=Sphingobium quisquiliarum P25 TaxID=1329909 RepID=T0GWE3_9SPHN|nr:nuclear transport factor 2 family protein [Sphingobium quisquiliarum]EQB04258.1 hypothetical protein L288_14360 [Sphingobium quisquiliarum P25]
MMQDLETMLEQRGGERRAALIAQDRHALEDLLADDLIHVHASGAVQNKGEFLTYALEVMRFVDIAQHEAAVRPAGDNGAIVSGAVTTSLMRRATGEQLTSRTFATQVWRRESGGLWRQVAYHATRLP